MQPFRLRARRRRRRQRIALFLGFLVGVIYVVLSQTRIVHDYIEEQFVEVVHRETGLIIDIRSFSLEWRWLPPSLTLAANEIRLDHPEHGKFASAERLLVEPGWWRLLLGDVAISRVELHEPELTLLIEDGKVLNGPLVPESSDEEASLELPFSRFIIIDGKIDLEMDGKRSHLSDLRLDVKELPEGLELFLSTGKAQIAYEEIDERINSLVVSIRLPSLDEVFIDSLSLRMDDGEIDLRGAHLPLPFERRFDARSIRVDLDLAALERAPDDLGLPEFSGRLHVEGEVNTDGPLPAFEGRVVANDLIIDGTGVGGLIDLNLYATEERVELRKGTTYNVMHEGGRAHIEGVIELRDDIPMALDVDIEHLKLELLLKQLAVTDNAVIDWALAGKARLEGQLLPFNLAGPLKVRAGQFILTSGPFHARPRSTILEARGGDIEGRIDITDIGIHFDHLHLDTGRSRAVVDFLIGFSTDFWLFVRESDIDLAEISPLAGIPMAGRASATVAMGDHYSPVALHGRYSIQDFEFGDMLLGEVHDGLVDLEKDGVAVRFHQLSGTQGETNYFFSNLFLDFEKELEIDASGRFDRFTLADLRKVFRLEDEPSLNEVDATGSGTVEAHYTLGFPGDSPTGTLHLNIDTTLSKAEILGVPFEGGEAKLTVDWRDFDEGVEGMFVDLKRVHFRKNGGTFSLDGRLLYDGILKMDAVFDRVALEDIPAIRSLSEGLTGSASAIGRIDGTLDVPRLDFDIRLSNLTYLGELLGDGFIQMRLIERAALSEPQPTRSLPPNCREGYRGLADARWSRTRVPTADGKRPPNPPMAWIFCGDAFGGSVAVDLAIGWADSTPLRGTILAKDFRLAPFLPKSEGKSIGEGTLSGSLRLTGGGLSGREGLSGALTITQLSASIEGMRIWNQEALEVDLSRGEAVVKNARLIGDGGSFELRGRGRPERLAFELEGKLDVEALGTITPLVRGSAGTLTVNASIGGPLDDPTIQGAIRLGDISFFARDLPVPVRGLEGALLFDGRRLTLDGVQARVGGGMAKLSGRVDVQNLAIRRYTIEANFQEVSLSPADGLQLALGGDVRLRYERGERLPTLEGIVELERLRYTKAMNLSPTIGELNKPRRESVDDAYMREEYVNLDLELRMKRPAEIRNNVADVDIVVDEQREGFRIVGSDARPGAIGNLRISRGSIRFRNSDFVVRDGILVFASSEQFNPRFDITATTQIIRADIAGPMWRIALRAHGTMDAFQLDATSEPSLTQQDIALLLTIGMTGAEAQNVQADALSGAALEALSAVTGVDDELTNALGVVDDISLTTAYHPVTNRPEPQVTISKRLTDRIRLRASTGLASETRDVRAAAQWRLGEQTSLELQYDNIDRESASSFGNIGVDIRWRLEFE